MKPVQLMVKNAIIYIPETDTYLNGSLAAEDGIIVAMGRGTLPFEAERTLDARGMLLLPGGVDPHVHLRDPGNTERETFATGTMAAAAGGNTMLVEHPISKPPQYSPEILQRRIDAAKPQAFVDYGFVGAAGGARPHSILQLAEDGRILGYKTFLHAPPNGRKLEFEGLTMGDDYELYRGLQAVAKTGHHCLVHAEDDDLIKGLTAEYRARGKVYPLAHAETRPAIAEAASVRRVIGFAKETGAAIEFCHISTPEAARIIKEEKQKGTRLFMETCPHYLLLSTDDLQEKGPYAKCNPPLRSPQDRDRLWDYIEDGSIDMIGSDHAPFLKEEKERGREDIFQAMSGFPGLELRMSLMLTAVKQGRLPLKRCVELLCVNPAKIFGIYPQKGTLQIGGDADFTIVDMDNQFTVKRESMYTKAKEIAWVYEGWRLYGRPVFTAVRGRIVLEEGVVDPSCRGHGTLVTRRQEEESRWEKSRASHCSEEGCTAACYPEGKSPEACYPEGKRPAAGGEGGL